MSQTPVLPKHQTHPDIASALRDCRRAFWSVAAFSGAVNMLMFAGPLYMLQVYDRVLSARSVPTLVALTIFLVGAYGFQALFDLIRTRVVVRAASVLDYRLGTTVHAAVIQLGLRSRTPAEAQQPVRDLDQIRSFLTGAGPIAIVDMPWMPLFLAVCFLIHPWLGLLSLAGALILSMMALLTEWASRAPAQAVARDAGVRNAMIEADRRNSESVVAMGMMKTMAARWTAINVHYLGASQRASDVVGAYGSLSKVLRLLMQSAVLGLGAFLVIQQDLTAGSMIAASIMMGRALAPIEIAIANWRSFVAARQSIRRLSHVLARLPSKAVPTELPAPCRSLEVEGVVVMAPGSDKPIVRDLRFRLNAGEALGIVGQNAAGKSSLLRTLVGIWPPARGVVRLDGAALDQFDPEFLGRHIGFVSQQVELFDGTVAENIARMAVAPDSAAVLQAGRAAGIHDMVLRFPDGYDTRIGEDGMTFSSGQRQRIALARALYGSPFLVVLDEPHANLDSDGENTVTQVIQHAKARGAIVVVIAHRPSALAACDKVLYLANGMQAAFGPRDEVLSKILVRPNQTAAPAPLKVVGDSGADR